MKQEEKITELIELKNYLQVGDIVLTSNQLSYDQLVHYLLALLDNKIVKQYLRCYEQQKQNGTTRYTE